MGRADPRRSLPLYLTSCGGCGRQLLLIRRSGGVVIAVQGEFQVAQLEAHVVGQRMREAGGIEVEAEPAESARISSMAMAMFAVM